MVGSAMKIILIEGSGAVELAELLSDDFAQHGVTQLITSPLDFFSKTEFGEIKIIPEKLPEAFTQCKVKVKSAMKKGINSILIPYTWGNAWAKQYYLNQAQVFGYEVKEILIQSRYPHPRPQEIPNVSI